MCKDEWNVLYTYVLAFIMERKDISFLIINCMIRKIHSHLYDHPQSKLKKVSPPWRPWWTPSCQSITDIFYKHMCWECLTYHAKYEVCIIKTDDIIHKNVMKCPLRDMSPPWQHSVPGLGYFHICKSSNTHMFLKPPSRWPEFRPGYFNIFLIILTTIPLPLSCNMSIYDMCMKRSTFWCLNVKRSVKCLTIQFTKSILTSITAIVLQ